jgi:hypothetical protein
VSWSRPGTGRTKPIGITQRSNWRGRFALLRAAGTESTQWDGSPPHAWGQGNTDQAQYRREFGSPALVRTTSLTTSDTRRATVHPRVGTTRPARAKSVPHCGSPRHAWGHRRHDTRLRQLANELWPFLEYGADPNDRDEPNWSGPSARTCRRLTGSTAGCCGTAGPMTVHSEWTAGLGGPVGHSIS